MVCEHYLYCLNLTNNTSLLSIQFLASSSYTIIPLKMSAHMHTSPLHVKGRVFMINHCESDAN